MSVICYSSSGNKTASTGPVHFLCWESVLADWLLHKLVHGSLYMNLDKLVTSTCFGLHLPAHHSCSWAMLSKINGRFLPTTSLPKPNCLPHLDQTYWNYRIHIFCSSGPALAWNSKGISVIEVAFHCTEVDFCNKYQRWKKGQKKNIWLKPHPVKSAKHTSLSLRPSKLHLF